MLLNWLRATNRITQVVLLTAKAFIGHTENSNMEVTRAHVGKQGKSMVGSHHPPRDWS